MDMGFYGMIQVQDAFSHLSTNDQMIWKVSKTRDGDDESRVNVKARERRTALSSAIGVKI
jgi:hypothetical protein